MQVFLYVSHEKTLKIYKSSFSQNSKVFLEYNSGVYQSEYKEYNLQDNR